ncbi:MAG: S41 family peptidase [Patescibacteria group bacterium]
MTPYVYKKRSAGIFYYVAVGLISFILGWQATVSGFIDYKDDELASKTKMANLDKEVSFGVDMNLFWRVWGELEDKYVDLEAIEEDTMVYGSIKGLVDSLDDPYTVFMTPDESTEFTSGLDGTLKGIGAELTVEDKNLVIISPLRGSPAEKAGLLPRDIILAIDGEIASDMTLVDAISKIRGEVGTTVTLTIVRKNVKKPFDVSIVRENIEIESVTVEKLDGDIVYLGVNRFNDKTNEEFSNAISEMLLDEPKGLIVDLRFNGGGYLDIAVELLSYLLPSNTSAVVIKERGKKDDTKLTNGKPKLLNTPLVVIVNDSSASASEIVAGAIQDHKRGIILGTKTFGKGSVQEVEKFSDGSSLRLTIAKWFTPNGRSINKTGLIPDILVEITEKDIDDKYDRQKEEAVKYLKNL